MGNDESQTAPLIERIVIVLLLLGLPALSIWSLQPPSPLPADAPPEVFSAERAMRHVEAIARAPHPTGSAENDRVRDYLFGVMQGLGLNPRVETREFHWQGRDWTLHNLVGRLEGSGELPPKMPSGGVVLLMAHYDSVSAGPGAADDAAGVAAILEAIRAIRDTPGALPLHNDTIVLLTDGEEQNLLGARATAEQADWLNDVSVVLNFEARGTSGPSIMFEANANWWLIEQLAETPHPVGTSLAAEIYEHMPNDTDFTVIAGTHPDRAFHRIYGLNFAFIDGASRYHTAADTPQNLSLASLQHHGEYALHLTRRLGDHPAMPMIIRSGGRTDAQPVYFPVPGVGLLAYPAILSSLAMIYLCPAVALVAMFRVTAGSWRAVAAILLCLVADALAISLAVGLTWAALQVLPFAYPHPNSRLPNELQSTLYLLGILAIAVTAHFGIVAAAARQWRITSATVAAIFVSLVAALAASLWVPGGTYLFIWPIIAAGIALGLHSWATRFRNSAPIMRLLGSAVLISATLVLYVPVIYMAALALSIRAGFVVVAVVMLALAMLSLPLQQLAPRRPWIVALGAAAVAAILLIIGAFMA